MHDPPWQLCPHAPQFCESLVVSPHPPPVPVTDDVVEPPPVPLPQTHDSSPEPSALQVCTPCLPPGHAHATCAPGMHTLPPAPEFPVPPVPPQAIPSTLAASATHSACLIIVRRRIILSAGSPRTFAQVKLLVRRARRALPLRSSPRRAALALRTGQPWHSARPPNIAFHFRPTHRPLERHPPPRGDLFPAPPAQRSGVVAADRRTALHFPWSLRRFVVATTPPPGGRSPTVPPLGRPPPAPIPTLPAVRPRGTHAGGGGLGAALGGGISGPDQGLHLADAQPRDPVLWSHDADRLPPCFASRLSLHQAERLGHLCLTTARGSELHDQLGHRAIPFRGEPDREHEPRFGGARNHARLGGEVCSVRGGGGFFDVTSCSQPRSFSRRDGVPAVEVAGQLSAAASWCRTSVLG